MGKEICFICAFFLLSLKNKIVSESQQCLLTRFKVIEPLGASRNGVLYSFTHFKDCTSSINLKREDIKRFYVTQDKLKMCYKCYVFSAIY